MRKRHEVKYDQPVVMEKPTHQKAMHSIKVSGEGGFYKAYKDGKEFLIPKTNLEAMKELVNYKMRRKGDSTFVRAPDAEREKKQLKHFQDKLKHLALKMDDYEETELKPLERELMKYKRSTVHKEIDPKFKMSKISSVHRGVSTLETKSLSVQNVSKSDEEPERGTKFKMSGLSRVDRGVSSLKTKSLSRKTKSLSIQSVSESHNESVSTKSMSDEIMLQSFAAPDVASVKFLVSGHFRHNKKPIFIIRQYRGASVIGGKTADFSSNKTVEDVDILISGKFYRKTILEESTRDKPTTIRFKDRKKILIDSRSTILENGFIELFPASKFDVVVGGMFVKTPSSSQYTPLVSIAVKRSRQSTYTYFGDRFSSSEKRATVMAVSTPVIENPFVDDLRKTHSDPKNRFRHRQAAYSVTREPQSFKNLLTRIEEGEEIFECPTEDDQGVSLVAAKPIVYGNTAKPIPSKKPGFFKRIFKKLFSR